MDKRTCKLCTQAIPEGRPKQTRYCSPRCASKSHVDSTKPCTVDGCSRNVRARGLCGSHYNTKYQNHHRHPKKLVPCAWCGTEVLRASGGGRKYGPTCSNECRRWLTTPWCVLPQDHWARWYGKASKWEPPALQHTITCAWCGDTHRTWQSTAKYCSRPCGKRAGKARRRARECNAPGEYTWASVIKLHLLADKRCSYCDQHTDQPEPDHVVPLSRAGRNDIGNILPCCQQCNGDKGDMTLTEWAAYRMRREKQTVRTEFDWRDKRFVHLMLGEATGQSHRLKTEFERAA